MRRVTLLTRSYSMGYKMFYETTHSGYTHSLPSGVCTLTLLMRSHSQPHGSCKQTYLKSVSSQINMDKQTSTTCTHESHYHHKEQIYLAAYHSSRISWIQRKTNIWVKDKPWVKEEKGLLSQENSWLSMASGKEDQVTQYLKLQDNYRENLKRQNKTGTN